MKILFILLILITSGINLYSDGSSDSLNLLIKKLEKENIISFRFRYSYYCEDEYKIVAYKERAFGPLMNIINSSDSLMPRLASLSMLYRIAYNEDIDSKYQENVRKISMINFLINPYKYIF